MSRTWLLLDCNYLCHRALHTTGGLTYNDIKTGVIYGVLRDIVAWQKRFDTANIAFCFDYGLNKRKILYPGYKHKRHTKEKTIEEQLAYDELQRQVNLLRTQYLPNIGYRNIFYQDGYEADDMIGSLFFNTSYGLIDDVIIVTGDEDMYQLLNDYRKWRVFHPQKNKIVTELIFRDEHSQITPEQWVFVKAIAGCGTDEIKGVEGVGQKKAIQFLTNQMKVGTKTYNNIIEFQFSEQYQINLKLIRLPFKGTDIFGLRRDDVTNEKWLEVSKSLGMKSLEDGPSDIVKTRVRKSLGLGLF